LVIFWQNQISTKAACKMLMLMITGMGKTMSASTFALCTKNLVKMRIYILFFFFSNLFGEPSRTLTSRRRGRRRTIRRWSCTTRTTRWRSSTFRTFPSSRSTHFTTSQICKVSEPYTVCIFVENQKFLDCVSNSMFAKVTFSKPEPFVWVKKN